LDRATDVLSFPALTSRPGRGFCGHLGDLALDWPYVRREFPRFEETLSAETALVLLHGCLHLSGRHHDHPREEALMWRLQRRMMGAAGPRARMLPLPARTPSLRRKP
jgi:probable rRNA maturation factor